MNQSIEAILTDPFHEPPVPFLQGEPEFDTSLDIFNRQLRSADGQVLATGFMACAYSYAVFCRDFHVLDCPEELFQTYINCSICEYKESEHPLTDHQFERQLITKIYRHNMQWLAEEALHDNLPQLEYEALIRVTQSFLTWMAEQYRYVNDHLKEAEAEKLTEDANVPAQHIHHHYHDNSVHDDHSKNVYLKPE